MKKAILFLILVLCLTTQAQNTGEPEFAYRPYIVHTNGSLQGFERVDMRIESSPNSLGRNWQSFYIVFEAKSTLRISKGAIPKFIIKIEPGKDPEDFVKLYLGTVKKAKRKFLYDARPEDLKKSLVKTECKKIGEGIYQILLPDILETGEYALISGDTKLSCFGVD